MVITFLSLLLAMLPQAASVRGAVVENHSGAAVQAVTVRLSTPQGAVLRETETDRDGRFLIGDLAEGEYLTTISKANFAPVTARFKVSKEPLEVSVRLTRYGVISGEGKGAVIIERMPEGKSPRVIRGTAGDSPQYRVFGIPPGRYVVAFINQRNLTLYPVNGNEREFVVKGGEEYSGIDMPVPTGHAAMVAGKIPQADSPQPPSIATVLVSPYAPTVTAASTSVASNGRFRYDSVLPGTYDIFVNALIINQPPLFGRTRINVNGANIEDIVVPLSPGVAAEFSLQPGTCSGDATINLLPLEIPALGNAVRKTARVSPGKSVRIENLAPVSYEVTVRSVDGTCFGVTPSVLDLTKATAAVSVPVTMKPAATLKATVAGSVKSATSVVLRDLEPGRDSSDRMIVATFQSPLAFEGLAPGHYCIGIPVESKPFHCDEFVFELAPGEEKTVQVPQP